MAKTLEEIDVAFRRQQSEKIKKETKEQIEEERQEAKRIKKTKMLMILCFLMGMVIFIYPSLSDYVARRNVIDGANYYEQQLTDLSDEKIVKMLEEAKAYNDSLQGNPVPDPFIPGSGRIIPENYFTILDMGDSIMGYVDIPSINVYQPIRHDTSEEVLKNGAGHIEQTALPIGGKGNLAVVTAHTGFAGAAMFDRLVELENGDKFLIHVLDRTFTYQVDDIKVILPEEVESLLPVVDKDYVVLMTCTPYGVNSHRLLVRGERIPNAPSSEQTTETVPFPWKLVVMIVVAVVLFIGIILGSMYRRKVKQRHL